jgi:hypothetical protein
MSAKADEYRRRAEEADEIARTAPDKEGRANWEAIARQWRDLARQAEEQRW